jgi:Gpi18-like mannosyltransferase
VLLIVAIAARLALWPVSTADSTIYLDPWVQHLRTYGSVTALVDDFSNYTPPYLYLLALGSHLPGPPVTVVKTIGLGLDVALAVAVCVLAAILRPRPRLPLAAGVGTLLLPSVVLNAAMLGQCDALYVTPLVLALALVLAGRPSAACALIGMALAIKLQAVFILPVLLLCVLGRRVPWRALPWAVAGWAVAMGPALLAGRSPLDLLGTYRDQTGVYSVITLNAPNLYQWIPRPPLATTGALTLATLVLGGLVVWLVRARVAQDDALVVRACVLILLVGPFVLPRMHERYTFAADVVAVAYAVVVPRGWLIAVGVSTVSALAYLPFGIGLAVPMPILTGFEFALILLVARGLVAALRDTTATDITKEPALT